MKQFWNDLPGFVKAIVIIVLLIFIYIIGKNIIAWIKKRQAENLLSNSTIGGVNLGSVAQRIYSAFHEYYYGASEDEETAIISLLDVPKVLVPQLSDIYFQLYSKNLNSEFVRYLSSSDYARVQSQFS